jgi:hypothetical protein
MKLFSLVAVAVSLFVSFQAIAQDFTVPVDYKLVAKEDYAPYEKDVVAASKWLQATPLNEQEAKRKETSAFVIQWISGSPTVNVTIYSIIMDLEKKNPGMLVIYMAAAAQYVLETKDRENNKAQEKFALELMSKVYASNKTVSKDKKMEKLTKSIADGRLDEWMKDNLK